MREKTHTRSTAGIVWLEGQLFKITLKKRMKRERERERGVFVCVCFVLAACGRKWKGWMLGGCWE